MFCNASRCLAVHSGRISVASVDTAMRRVLLSRFKVLTNQLRSTSALLLDAFPLSSPPRLSPPAPFLLRSPPLSPVPGLCHDCVFRPRRSASSTCGPRSIRTSVNPGTYQSPILSIPNPRGTRTTWHPHHVGETQSIVK